MREVDTKSMPIGIVSWISSEGNGGALNRLADHLLLHHGFIVIAFDGSGREDNNG